MLRRTFLSMPVALLAAPVIATAAAKPAAVASVTLEAGEWTIWDHSVDAFRYLGMCDNVPVYEIDSLSIPTLGYTSFDTGIECSEPEEDDYD